MSAIVEWFRGDPRLGVNKLSGNEIHTDCPYCGRENFFFNVRKRVGVCHHAKCGETPKLKDLIDLIGYGPKDLPPAGEDLQFEEPAEAEVVALDAPPLAIDRNTVTNPDAYNYLVGRGLTINEIIKYDIRYDGSRIYVPIKDEKGRILQYNSRILDETTGYKYKYADVNKVTDYMLGWEEIKLHSEITLVENTFVAIWLNRYVPTTTCFGSHVSDTQAFQMEHSAVRSVAILWDGGAESKASKAREKLRDLGIACAFGSIKGQPDDYDLDTNLERIKLLHELAKRGTPCQNLV